MDAMIDAVLTNAVTAALWGIGVALVGLFCRKRPALLHTLWVLVLLKLVTPPLFHVPIAWLTILAEQTSGIASPSDISALPTEMTNQPTPVVGEAPDRPVPAVSLSPGLASHRAVNTEPTATDWAWSDWLGSSLDLRFLFSLAFSIQTIACCVWLAGAIGFAAAAGRRIRLFQHLLREGAPADSAVQTETMRLAQRIGLGRCPDVWTVPGPISPSVWAVGGRARILVPAALLSRLGEQGRAAVLTHELAHIRRRDHWIRWLELVVLTLFWWHPVAWLARRQLQRLEEECCDGWVVATRPEASRAYAGALLETLDFLSGVSAVLPPVASGFGYARFLKRRLHMILSDRASYRLSWPGYLGAACFGLMILPTAPGWMPAQNEPAPAPEVVEEQPTTPAPSSTRPDLEGRLRTLEQRMDRILSALEKSQRAGPAPSGELSPESQKRLEEARERARAVRERAQALKEQRAKLLERDRELHREIEEAVRQAINPERMKDLERQIQETVAKTINPERMEQMGKQIEQAVNQAVNPQRLEALGRQIEEAVRRAVRVEERTEARRRPEAGRGKGAGAAVARTGPPDSRQLEERMNRLEEKMNRVLETLEQKKGDTR